MSEEVSFSKRGEKSTTKIYSRAPGTAFQVDNAEVATVRISTQLHHKGRKGSAVQGELAPNP